MYEEYIEKIRLLPVQIEELVDGLTDEQLTTHYLDGEWTAAQNVHHLVDSHANSYMRCKLIMTEDNPPLRGYDQDAWAELPEAKSADIHYSLTTLLGLHDRWVNFFYSLSESDWVRTGQHSEIGQVSLADIVQSYARHGEAHIDQIKRTLAAGGVQR